MKKLLLTASPVTLRGVENFARMPNLGLASIAGNINRNTTLPRVADLAAAPGCPEKFLMRIISEFQPDIVGFSAMTFQYQNTLYMVRKVKQFYPDIITFLGGYHATAAYREISSSADMDFFDFIVRGEGEISVRELIDKLDSSGNDFSSIAGISFRNESGKIIHTPERVPADLAEISLPDREARILSKGFYFLGGKADVVETSRGCVFNCGYCSIKCMYGSTFRKFPVERVIADLKQLKANDVEFVMLADDNITLDPERFIRLCCRIKEEGLDSLGYIIQTGVKTLLSRPELPEIMTDAGMKYIFLSLDDPDSPAADFFNTQEFRKDDAFRLIRELRSRGAMVMGGCVIGAPRETEKSLMDTYRFIGKTGVDAVAFLILIPYPGTPVRASLMEKNLITNLSDYSRYTHEYANIRTHGLSSERLAIIVERMNVRYMFEYNSIWRFILKFPIHIFKRFLVEILHSPKRIMKRGIAFCSGLLSRLS